MQCYEHQTQPAVAVCRNCGKALCFDCCKDAGQRIACGAVCKDALLDEALIADRLKQSLGIGSDVRLPVSVVTYALFGLILLGVATYTSVSRPQIDYLTFAMAAVFIVMAGASYRNFRHTCRRC